MAILRDNESPSARDPTMAKGGGRLFVYVTSHGFGHLNRSVAVINRIPGHIPITIRSDANLFPHWRERLLRPADLVHYVADVGTLSPPGDSAATDGPATLARAAQVHGEAMQRLADEARAIKDAGVAAVLCDAPPVPLAAARIAGVPAYLLANFTWAEIYESHARRAGTTAEAFVGELRNVYRRASLVFRAEPSLRMLPNLPTLNVGMVVSPGRPRKKALRSLLGLTRSEKGVYFYIGRYGQTNLAWERIERLGARGYHFVGFHAPASGHPANFHVVPPGEWTGADLAASADVVVAKAGYGTVCEAMAAGTPMIYPPRSGFAEHRALDRALRNWGGGVPAPSRAFVDLKLERLLDRAIATNPGPPPFPVDGAARVADRLAAACQTQARA